MSTIMENDAGGQPHKKTRVQINSDQLPSPNGHGDTCTEHAPEMDPQGNDTSNVVREDLPVSAVDVVDPTAELANAGHELVAAADGLTPSS